MLAARTRWWPVGAAGGLAVTFWIAFFVLAYQSRGLFNFLGVDFGPFWAAAQALRLHNAAAIADLDVLAIYNRELTAYYAPGVAGVVIGPVAYPPVMFLALEPLTLVAPPLAFVAWTLANLSLALVVLRGLAARFAGPGIVVVLAVLGAYLPLEQTLFVGQINIILVWGLYRAYLAFERGDDLRAGVWAGLLLLKPQYALGLALVLLLKRRWQALIGLGATGLVLAVSSIALLGPDGLAPYLSILSQYSGFRQVHPTTFPEGMISWRGLLVDAAPMLGEADGLRATTLLSAAALGLLPLLWRGPWRPTDESFARRMLGTMIVTMLVSFHNHLSGATLLLVPGMLVSARTTTRPLRALLGLGLVLPPLAYLLLEGRLAIVAHLFTLLMLATLGAVLAAELGRVQWRLWPARSLAPNAEKASVS